MNWHFTDLQTVKMAAQCGIDALKYFTLQVLNVMSKIEAYMLHAGATIFMQYNIILGVAIAKYISSFQLDKRIFCQDRERRLKITLVKNQAMNAKSIKPWQKTSVA